MTAPAVDLDLTAATEAAYRAHHAARRGWEPSPEEFQATYSRTEAEWMAAAVDAAAPLIAAQVAEQIAREIERARDNDMSSSAWRARQESFTYAARIAREAVR
jgi:hypothetical protein